LLLTCRSPTRHVHCPNSEIWCPTSYAPYYTSWRRPIDPWATPSSSSSWESSTAATIQSSSVKCRSIYAMASSTGSWSARGTTSLFAHDDWANWWPLWEHPRHTTKWYGNPKNTLHHRIANTWRENHRTRNVTPLNTLKYTWYASGLVCIIGVG